eukprot:scaffold133419_cov81-Phaeocystis_antarctica.AAC.1
MTVVLVARKWTMSLTLGLKHGIKSFFSTPSSRHSAPTRCGRVRPHPSQLGAYSVVLSTISQTPFSASAAPSSPPAPSSPHPTAHAAITTLLEASHPALPADGAWLAPRSCACAKRSLSADHTRTAC